MDTYGRKRIQIVGFAAMAISFIALAFVPLGGAAVAVFVILFALNYFFTECGPNTTTFVYPAEIFPVRVRTTSHGIAATSGKIGAAIGAFVFPYLLARFGVPGPMIAAGVVSAIGIAATARLPEPMGQSLEDASRDRSFAGGSQTAAATA
jgi:MFS family permease